MKIRSTMLIAVLAWGAGGGGVQGGEAENPLTALSRSVQELTQRASRAVVEISADLYSESTDAGARLNYRVARQHSVGAGVIVDSSGYIMTNAHVIDGAIGIRVTVAGDSAKSGAPDFYDAHLVGVDADSDLALLKIGAAKLPSLDFGDSAALSPGELVFAIGSPLQFRNSVSMGVVSGTGRVVSNDSPVRYIQTDASINPGDSGGALIDPDGRLVGLNTFIVSQSGGSEGIGFAVPVDVVSHVYSQLRLHGTVTRGSIGVFVQDITPPLARALQLPASRGVLVSDVDPESSGYVAGLQRRDIILRLDDRPVLTARDFTDALIWRDDGAKIGLIIQRGPERFSVTAQVRSVAESSDPLSYLETPEKHLVARLGLFCLELDQKVNAVMPALRKSYGIVVMARLPESPSELEDLQTGDVIHAVNGLPVSTLDAFRSRIDEFTSGDAVALQVERAGRIRYVAFDIR